MTVRQAVILAAGEGSRMRPLTWTRPKVMLPIAAKPILEHLILDLKQAGIDEIMLVTGYKSEIIQNYFKDGADWGIRIIYCPQTQQLGTGDAVRMVEKNITGDFIVANGDIYLNKADVINLTQQSGNVMAAIELADVSGLGVLETKGKQVIRLHEKSPNPPSHLANAGLYRFTPAIFESIARTGKSPRGEYELTDAIQILIDSGNTVEHILLSNWLDLGYPWHLLKANEQIMPNLQPLIEGVVEPNVNLQGPVSVGKGTRIRSGSYIIGPVIIGRNCDIGPNCFIRPNTTIGDHCHIGAAVEIKNSIIMSNSKVPHLNYVGDSVIGENCNLGAGTKIANLKLTKTNIIINDVDTGRHKLGAIIGDNVQTGINASINTGTLIGNNVLIGPGALAKGNIAPRTKVF